MSKVRLRVYDRPQGVLFGSPPSERTFIKNHKAPAFTDAYISHATLIVLTVAETMDRPDFYHWQANVAETS